MCLEENIQPNQKFMECLEEFKKKCKVKLSDTVSHLILIFTVCFLYFFQHIIN